jgi:hypothetical protein
MGLNHSILSSVLCLLLVGCAKSSVMDLDSNTIQITTEAAPVCGQGGAQQVAAKRAAYETLRRGYDKYVILGGNYQNNVGVVGHTPIIANTYGSGNINTYGNTGSYSGQSSTYVSGGQPIIGGTHNQGLAVRLFRTGEPGSENAIDARNILGPEWQEIMAKEPGQTC